MSLQVGFIGLGDQGAPMAEAIAEAGFDLFVWARRPESLETVAKVPHTVCATIAEVGERSDVLGLCLRDDNDIEDVVFKQDLISSMRPGAVVVNHGTGSPDVCEDWAARCSAAGVQMLDAPVSGGRAAALTHTLTTMVGGSTEAAEKCKAVFEAFSGLITYLGGPGAGQFAKLMNNTLMASNLKSSQEAIALADELGFDVGGLVEILLSSSGANFALEAMAKLMTPELAEHYTKMVGKDVGHFSDAARARGVAESPLEARAQAGVAGIIATVNRLHQGSSAT